MRSEVEHAVYNLLARGVKPGVVSQIVNGIYPDSPITIEQIVTLICDPAYDDRIHKTCKSPKRNQWIGSLLRREQVTSGVRKAVEPPPTVMEQVDQNAIEYVDPLKVYAAMGEEGRQQLYDRLFPKRKE